VALIQLADMIQCFSSPSIHPFPFSISTVRIGKMSRDKAVLPMLKCHPARPIFCRVLCCLYLLYISQSCSVDISIPIFPLVIFFVMLCRSCWLSLSPAVSLSGPGVGFGDSVLWILPWLRPKLLGPHGAAAPPDQLPAHPLIFLPTFPGTLDFGLHQLLL